MLQVIQKTGNAGLSLLSCTLQSIVAFLSACTPPFYIRNFLQQLYFVGFGSLPIVGMTAFFSGAVMALQSYSGFARFAAESSIPNVVAISLTRELAPVLTALMLTSRVGAAFAAELATMKISEQIDALYTLATDSIKFLITPRVAACVICMPILVLIADGIGIFGGYIVAVYKLGFNPTLYLDNTVANLTVADISSGLTKAVVFGFIVSIVSCICGYNSSRGSEGVGKATTNAVVMSSIMVLISNYIVTALLF